MTSIPEFLNQLDYEQLKFCRDECEARMRGQPVNRFEVVIVLLWCIPVVR